MRKYRIFIMTVLICPVLVGCTRKEVDNKEVDSNAAKVGLYHLPRSFHIISVGSCEDHYIVLKKSEQKIIGLYYGTTDDFDGPREGYYPGFFVLPMDSLLIENDSIKFVLRPQKNDFFTKAIDRSILSSQEAMEMGYEHWDVLDSYGFDSIQKYSGVIDSLTIRFPKGIGMERSKRIFYKYPMIPSIYEVNYKDKPHQ